MKAGIVMPGKHEVQKPEKKRRGKRKRTLLKILIVIELILAVAASCAVFYISMGRIADRRGAAIMDTLAGFKGKSVSKDMDKFIEKAKEQISEKKDETVWATDSVNYRTGPGVQYDRAGTLAIYTGVKRTGVTFNDWSQVKIGDDTYYISSEFLTTEVPLITDTGAKGEYQRYAMSLFPDFGWEETEIVPLIQLWNRESGWNPNSHNGSSGAHGIPQALPASKMASEGSDYYTNGNTQIRWGLKYIKNRYGSPSGAWAHFQSSNWY